MVGGSSSLLTVTQHARFAVSVPVRTFTVALRARAIAGRATALPDPTLP